MASRRRALALAGAACAAALAVAGCSSTGSSSKSSSVTVSGHTLTIYLSAPSDWRTDPSARDLIHAEQLAFDQQRHEVTHFALSEHVLSFDKLSDNARMAIQDPTAIAFVGDLAPGASEQTVGITNALDLPQVSATDTAYELAAASPVVAGTPTKYFEQLSSYGRTFVRMVPTTAQEASFLVKQMLGGGTGSLYVADDGSDYGRTIADFVETYAQHAGFTISKSEAGAASIFYGAQAPAAATKFFDSTASDSPSAKLYGSSSLDASSFLSGVSATVARRLLISTPGIPAGQLNASGRAFDSSFAKQYGSAPGGQAIFGYAAMAALLSALEKAGANANSRATVAKDLLGTHDQPSVLGNLSIDSAGNSSFDEFVLNRVSGGALVPVKRAS